MSNGGGTLRTLQAADTCTAKMLIRLNKAFVPFTRWETILLTQPLISLREQLYTVHFLKKKILNDLMFYCVFHLLFLISIIPKSGLIFVDGEELGV